MKNNFIILIGSDGAGKSTIAQALHNELGYPVEHHGPVKSYEEGKREYFLDIHNKNYSVIKDRFHEGERIFAPIYRGYEADYFKYLEFDLKMLFNPLLVYVHAPYSVIEQRLTERGEDFVKPEHFRFCCDKVLEVFNDSTLPKIMVETSEYESDYNVARILTAVHRK